MTSGPLWTQPGLVRAVIVSLGYAASLVAAFAATYPDRTRGIVLFNPIVRDRVSPDYPWAPSDEDFEAELDNIRNHWATLERAAAWLGESGPSRANDVHFINWWAEQERRMGSAEDALALVRLQRDTDVVAVLPAIHVPTLVLIRTASPVDRSRYRRRTDTGCCSTNSPRRGPDGHLRRFWTPYCAR